MDPIRYTENLYPTPIQNIMLSGEELLEIQQEMALAVSKVNWVKLEEWGNTHWLSSESFSDTIEHYNLVKFREVLERELNAYCNDLDFTPKKYKLTSWFSKFEKDDFGHAHNHGASDISGCYYFQTNGDDGNIYFLSPNNAAACSLPYGHRNQQWFYTPMVGKMLLFPGWLFHGIKRNNTDNVRISFAFNVTYER